LPYSETTYANTQDWLRQRGLFEQEAAPIATSA
jgi:hypothetical protein